MATAIELEKKYYSDKPGWVNGTTRLHELIAWASKSGQTVALEVGPGPQNKTTTFMAEHVARLDGLDIDELACTNPALANLAIYDGEEFPIESESYDLVVADYVMEHVEHPKIVLSEISRVLKPGGHFIFRTPNLYHYVALFARFTPHRMHVALANPMRGRTDEAEPYPTFYRFNTRRRVRKITKQAGLQEIELRLQELQPSYLMFNPWAFRLGVLYERIVNSTDVFSQMRANLFGVYVKHR